MNGFEYCRKRAGLTQVQVAAALNVKQGTVCAWETSRSYPTGKKILALTKLYNCTPDELYAGAGNKKLDKSTLERIEMREFARKYGLEER